ncbi:MAG: zinc ribbon domain-containing protein [Oscillospiraceae bacterium]|nr:zinc ribbon domain-containing protein [Oscillospiraceae bacterium]
MKKLAKLNFKKAITIYLIAAFVCGIASATALGYLFRSKISLALDYEKISETDRRKAPAAYEDIAAFAEKHPEIAEALVLSVDRTIVFRAKDGGIVKGNVWAFEKAEEKRGRGRLTDPSQPGIALQWLDDDLTDPLRAVIDEREGHNRLDSEKDVLLEPINQKVYPIQSWHIRQNGETVVLLFDFRPVPRAALALRIVAAAVMLFFMLYWALVALWVYADAQKSKLRGETWGLLALFTNIAGLLVYLIYKGINQVCYQCRAVMGRENTYCTNCGAKLGETCAGCGGAVGKHSGFCGRCGQAQEEK